MVKNFSKIIIFIILGLLPLVIGFIFNNFFWVIFGIVYCAGSIGDLLTVEGGGGKGKNLLYQFVIADKYFR